MVQEEIIRNNRDGVTSIADEEDNCAIVGKGKEAKGMKAQVEAKSNQNNGKKKELSKIKCFHLHEYIHYETNCLHNKS